jgi:hypothetical protein
MKIPVFLLLLAASTRVILVDQIYAIPGDDWRYVDVILRQQGATVDCDFTVLSDHHEVRVGLVMRRDLERLRAGRSYEAIVALPPRSSGKFRYIVRDPGEYAVVVDNRDNRGPASVRLHVALDFSKSPESQAQSIPRSRQITVVVISFAAFFAIVTYSARKLLANLKNRS